MSQPAPTPRHDPFAALRHRDFALFILSRTIASMGGQMVAVAVGWQIYAITHQAFALGMMGMVQAVPAITLALWAGHVADRHDRRRILLGTESILILTSLGLVAVTSWRLPYYWIYAVLFFRGLAGGMQGPSQAALMPQLTPGADFPNAVTWRTTLFQVAAVVGPALGGVLLAHRRNPADVYAAEAVIGVLSLTAMTFMASRPVEPHDPEEPVLQSILGGIRFVRRQKAVLGAMALDLFAVLFGGAVALLPVFARDILHVGPVGLGILRAASSAGGMLTAIALLRRPPLRRSGPLLLAVVAAFGLTMIGFGLSRWFWLSMVFLAISGAVDNVSMVIRGTVVQAMTPNAMRGRVSAVNGVFIGASNELGAFESGVAAKYLGTVPSVVLGGTMTLVVVALAALSWPELRRLGRLDQLQIPVDDPSQEAVPPF
ncbi:MAG TPA: MFS transporter [Armatimonadota bacterium]